MKKRLQMQRPINDVRQAVLEWNEVMHIASIIFQEADRCYKQKDLTEFESLCQLLTKIGFHCWVDLDGIVKLHTPDGEHFQVAQSHSPNDNSRGT